MEDTIRALISFAEIVDDILSAKDMFISAFMEQYRYEYTKT